MTTRTSNREELLGTLARLLAALAGRISRVSDREELLETLAQSRRELNEAARIEKRKRWAIQRGGLDEALRQCREATTPAYLKAKEQLEETERAVREAKETAKGLQSEASTPNAGAAAKQSADELAELIAVLEERQSSVRDVIERKMGAPPVYNLTLFGRTMAGKSTLMEILTDGDGRSIGNGTQRTTTDVRTYHWKGLAITDVPGIAAFEGGEDEETAHEATSQADLIIFLITDDAPQDSEARHLARIRRSGKPVIGICNVKKALTSREHIKLFIRNQDRLFDLQELDRIADQFDRLADQYAPGRQLELVNTHLLARYQAGRSPSDAEDDGLAEASRFWEVEDLIVNEVVTNGPFLRRRAFIDTAATAALEAWEDLVDQSYLTTRVELRLQDRTRETERFRSQFRREASRKLDLLINNTIGDLRNKVPGFADQYCEDKQIHEFWQARVESYGIDEKLKRAIREVADECQTRLAEIVTDIETEIRIITQHQGGERVQHERIRDPRRWLRWGSQGLGATLSLGGAAVWAGALPVLAAIPGVNAVAIPLMVAGALVGIAGRLLGNLFGSREKRRREAVQRVAEQLQEHLDNAEQTIRGTFNQWYDEAVDLHAIRPAANQIQNLTNAARQAASVTRNLAVEQRASLRELNLDLVNHALTHTGHEGEQPKIASVARLPGQATVLTMRDTQVLSNEAMEALEGVLAESVVFIEEGKPATELIAQMCGVAYEDVEIDKENSTAKVAWHQGDTNTDVRVALARQLTGLHIRNTGNRARMVP